MDSTYRRVYASSLTLLVAACAVAGCSGSGGSASAVRAVPAATPTASAATRAPSSCTTSTAPALSGTESFVQAFDGGPGLDGAYAVSLSWTPGTYGQRVSQSGAPNGPFTVVQDSQFIGTGGGCENSATIGNLRPGTTYYFEVAGYTDATHLTPTSNVATLTIPPSSGDAGPLTVGGTNGSGAVSWKNPVQGYRFYEASSLAGTYSLDQDTGFEPDQEFLGFLLGVAAGTTVCVELQGYGSSGQLGPLEGPTCGTF